MACHDVQVRGGGSTREGKDVIGVYLLSVLIISCTSSPFSYMKGLPYNFQHFLVVARSHQMPIAQQPKKTKKARMSGEEGELIFDHFECEVMYQVSFLTYSVLILSFPNLFLDFYFILRRVLLHFHTQSVKRLILLLEARGVLMTRK